MPASSAASALRGISSSSRIALAVSAALVAAASLGVVVPVALIVEAEQLYRQVSVVFQDVYLFDQTIAENIRLARPDASDTDLERVAAAARVDEIVARLSDGWNTRVGGLDELISREGSYAGLWDARVRARGWRLKGTP